MMVYAHHILFYVVAAAIFILPLIPALIDLAHVKNIKPLKLQLDIQDTAYFAQMFAGEIERGFANEIKDGFPVSSEGTLGLDIPFQILAEDGDPALDQRRLVIGAGPIDLPADSRYAREVYSHQDLRIGPDSAVFAAYARRNLLVGAGTLVRMWMHGGNAVEMDHDVCVSGRITSGGLLQMQDGCRYKRVKARQIDFIPSHAAKEIKAERFALAIAHFATPKQPKRRVVDRNPIVIAPGEEVFDDIISAREILIGKGAILWGSLKSHRTIRIAEDVFVHGNIVAVESIRVGPRTVVAGAMIAERDILLEENCLVGTMDQPITLACRRMYCHEGVTVHGTISTTRFGAVRAQRA